MKKKFIFITFLFNYFVLNLFSQHIIGNNLVPNSDFEDYISCPNDISQIYKAIPWKMPIGNFNPGSPDFLNYCSQNTIINNILSVNNPLNGNGCAGLFLFGNSSIQKPNYREYLEVELISRMKKNNSYCCKFNTILSLYGGGAAIENIGMLITKTNTISYGSSPLITMIIDSIPNIKNKNGILTDSINWSKIKGVYLADGDEKYITIGNFSRDSNTNISIIKSNWLASYYLFDDVSVCECSFDINLGQDTSLCEGESILLNPRLPNASYTWQDSSHAATYEVKQPGIYWVRAYVAEYDITTSDTIVISADDEAVCNPPLIIPNFITPNGDGNNDDFSIGNADKYDISLQIFNRWGNMIYQNTSYQNDFNCKTCGEAVYYYLLTAKSLRSGKVKEYKGSVTVMK
jgi:gliding motility-associated-like protein